MLLLCVIIPSAGGLFRLSITRQAETRNYRPSSKTAWPRNSGRVTHATEAQLCTPTLTSIQASPILVPLLGAIGRVSSTTTPSTCVYGCCGIPSYPSPPLCVPTGRRRRRAFAPPRRARQQAPCGVSCRCACVTKDVLTWVSSVAHVLLSAAAYPGG